MEAVLAKDEDVALLHRLHRRRRAALLSRARSRSCRTPATPQFIVMTKDMEARERVRSRLMASVDEAVPAGLGARHAPRARPAGGLPGAVPRGRPRHAEGARDRARGRSTSWPSSPKVRDVQLDWNDPVRTLQGRPRPGQGARARPRARRRGARDADRDERRDAVAAARARGPDRHRRACGAVGAPRPRHAEGRQPLHARRARSCRCRRWRACSYELEEPVLWRRNRDMAITVRADVKDGEQGVSVTQEIRPLLKDIEAKLPVGLSHRRRRRGRGKRQGQPGAGRRGPGDAASRS